MTVARDPSAKRTALFGIMGLETIREMAIWLE
jgi:hypothetical protein